MVRTISNLVAWFKLDGDANDYSDDPTNGSWTGTEQYSTGKQFDEAGDFDTTNKVTSAASLTVAAVSFWINLTSNNTDLIDLASGKKISINGSDEITVTGLTNETIYVNNVATITAATGTYKLIYLEFDATTADAIAIGDGADGLIGDVRFYSSALSSIERAAIYNGGLGQVNNNLLFPFILGKTTNSLATSWAAKIEKNDSRKPNILKFGVLQSTNYVLGDEVKYFDLDQNYIFGGQIQKVTDNNGTQILEVADYAIEATETKVNEVYAPATTFEAILADLIATYSDWTLVTNITTGLSLNANLVFKDEWLSDALNKVLALVNATIRVDKNKDVTIFLLDTTDSGKTLAYGVDTLDGGWVTDNSIKAEKVIVKGAYVDQRTTETLIGTSQTEFNTTYTPENVEIDGFQQTTSTIDGDYTVDKANNLITFDSAQTDPVVSYTYKSQIRVEIGSGKTVVLEKKYLESRSEARKLGREYKARFKDGGVSSKWIKNTSDLDAYEVGNTIDVTDEKNNKTGTYTINRVMLELPKKMTIEIGLTEQDLFDQNKETIERIKQLEQINQNQDFITLDDFLTENISVSVATTFTELKGIINDGAILWASETALDSDGDLISDDGADEDFALAYDDDGIPSEKIIDYLA